MLLIKDGVDTNKLHLYLSKHSTPETAMDSAPVGMLGLGADTGNISPPAAQYEQAGEIQSTPSHLDYLITSGMAVPTETGIPTLITNSLVGITNPSTTDVMPIIQPALPSTVELSLTIVYITIFGLLFVSVYAQLWMIWYYRHKRLSHQTLFLFMCLVWAGLRTTLFSFYFYDCDIANALSLVPYWLLYSFPVCLQFSLLCLLLHFFAQIVLKAKAKHDPSKYKIPLRIFLSASVLAFITLNIAFAWLTRTHEHQYKSTSLKLVTIRVIMTEAMFFLYGCALSVCIYRMTKMASTERVLEAKGTTVRTAVITCILITLLLLSRTVYNVITIFPVMRKLTPTFGYDWVNVTDQADEVKGDLSQGLAYVSFGIVLFLWEVLPTSIVVIFFRVKRLHMGYVPTDFSQQHHGPRVFFFDNPRRYDSEDDLSQQSRASSYQEISSRHYSLNGETSRSWTPRVTPHGTPTTGTSWGAQGYQQQQRHYPQNSPSAQTYINRADRVGLPGESIQGAPGSTTRMLRYGSFDSRRQRVHSDRVTVHRAP